jgi:hypothetical protein
VRASALASIAVFALLSVTADQHEPVVSAIAFTVPRGSSILS